MQNWIENCGRLSQRQIKETLEQAFRQCHRCRVMAKTIKHCNSVRLFVPIWKTLNVSIFRRLSSDWQWDTNLWYMNLVKCETWRRFAKSIQGCFDPNIDKCKLRANYIHVMCTLKYCYIFRHGIYSLKHICIDYKHFISIIHQENNALHSFAYICPICLGCAYRTNKCTSKTCLIYAR